MTYHLLTLEHRCGTRQISVTLEGTKRHWLLAAERVVVERYWHVWATWVCVALYFFCYVYWCAAYEKQIQNKYTCKCVALYFFCYVYWCAAYEKQIQNKYTCKCSSVLFHLSIVTPSPLSKIPSENTGQERVRLQSCKLTAPPLLGQLHLEGRRQVPTCF